MAHVTREELKSMIWDDWRVRTEFKKRWKHSGPKCGGTWHCIIGGHVEHYGHMTAIYRYVGVSRNGKIIVDSNARAFRLLIDAQVAVLLESLKEYEVVNEPL